MFGQLKQDSSQVASSREKTGSSMCAGCAVKLCGRIPGNPCMSRQEAVDTSSSSSSSSSQALIGCEVLPGGNFRSTPGGQQL